MDAEWLTWLIVPCACVTQMTSEELVSMSQHHEQQLDALLSAKTGLEQRLAEQQQQGSEAAAAAAAQRAQLDADIAEREQIIQTCNQELAQIKAAAEQDAKR